MPTSSSLSVADKERALVRAFLRGRSESAFRKLYGTHSPALYGFALRLARGNEDFAQDIVQDTWVRAIDGLGGFRWRSSFKTWLHAVALNVFRELSRRHSLAGRKEEEAQWRFTVVRGAGPPPVDIERAICRLPDGQREVLLLYDIEGYTHQEIAMLLDIAEGTSKSQLSKARAAMRGLLDGQGAGFNAG